VETELKLSLYKSVKIRKAATESRKKYERYIYIYMEFNIFLFSVYCIFHAVFLAVILKKMFLLQINNFSHE
jgi:hypothetical protein